MKNKVLTTLAVVFMLAGPGARSADFSVAAGTRGWINANGTVGGSGNYLAGNCSSCFITGEYRNYFSFNLPAFSGTVTSAYLRIESGSVQVSQDPVITYQLTSLDELPASFAELGTGTLYGSLSDFGANFVPRRDIELNSAALAAMMSGGTFLLSGRLVGNIQFGAEVADQFLFGSTQATIAPNLFFVTAPATDVPEPATWTLLIAGLGLLGVCSRRRRVSVTT